MAGGEGRWDEWLVNKLEFDRLCGEKLISAGVRFWGSSGRLLPATGLVDCATGPVDCARNCPGVWSEARAIASNRSAHTDMHRQPHTCRDTDAAAPRRRESSVLSTRTWSLRLDAVASRSRSADIATAACSVRPTCNSGEFKVRCVRTGDVKGALGPARRSDALVGGYQSSKPAMRTHLHLYQASSKPGLRSTKRAG